MRAKGQRGTALPLVAAAVLAVPEWMPCEVKRE
jgi:hypothetical protein